MTSMDQVMMITDDELEIFNVVDEVITRAVTAGDPVSAFAYANMLKRSGQMKGLALAKLLYGLKQKWEIFYAAGHEDNFEDYTFGQTGTAPDTILKYTRMWESIFANDGISDEVKRKLMGKPIGDLLLLTGIAREGTDKMEALADAPDTNSLREIIKEERGERTSSASGLRIFLQLKNEGRIPRGAIFLKRGAGPEIVGSLDVDSEDENVKKAIARIVNSSGMMEMN